MPLIIPTSLDDIYPPIWSDKMPPYCEQHALQAVSVARSYWNARANGIKSFAYSHSTFLSGGNPINNPQGAGVIDCSTYMHLVLRGIRYQDSPYATGNATLSTNAYYPWTSNELGHSDTLSGTVRKAADIAAYYWAAGRVFPVSKKTDARPGDLDILQ